MTMYNEDEGLFTRTMQGVMKNIAYLCPMVWALLSEVPQIGHMPIYILTLATFVLLQITALATNYSVLMVFRFLAGFFGSPILATGGATVAHLYSPQKARVRDNHLGRLRCVGAEPGPAARELLAALRGLALNNPGPDVPLGRDARPALLPRDLRLQHPLPPRPPPAQGHGQHVDDLHL